MRDYAELLKALRHCSKRTGDCSDCPRKPIAYCQTDMAKDAADALEELLHIARKMHTWIFLNCADEQAAYDEIGLTDEQNAMLGYGGQIFLEKAEPPKEVE